MIKFSWQQIPSPIVTELMVNIPNFHGVIIDTEHSCWNPESIFSSIQIAKLSLKVCFVRIATLDKILIKNCLDSGADGLILANTESEDHAYEFKDLCLYPPAGKRGLGLQRENLWGNKQLISNDRDPILIAQIESKESIDNIRKITSANMNYYLIGPYDLSLSLDCPGDFESDVFKEYIKRFYDAIPPQVRAIHLPSKVEQQIEKYKQWGLIAVGMDTTMLMEKYQEFSNA